MRGTGDVKHFPHYEIFVHEQVTGSGFVSEKDSVYEFSLPGNMADSITYILINFDNDLIAPDRDRNLYVSDIYIDSVDIDSLTTDNFFFSNTIDPVNFYIPRVYIIKHYMGDLGYDTARVKLVEVDYVPVNKTLALARGAEQYLSKTEVRNINIITADYHSVRSYLNFKNCMKGSIEVGCIPVNIKFGKKRSLFKGFDDRVSLLLTWVYWWFH